MKRILFLLVTITPLIWLSSCTTSIDYGDKKKSTMDKLVVAEDFTFSTNKEVAISDIPGISSGSEWVDLYQDNSHDTLYIGRFKRDNLKIQVSNLGNLFSKAASLSPQTSSLKTTATKTKTAATAEESDIIFTPLFKNFYRMGDWDSDGVPLYLTTSDIVDNELLNDIDASLPESRPVPEYNPDYLTNQEMDTKINELADVWITFVHEGAGWKNTIGYYTYDLNNPPKTPGDIDSLIIIFPNVSFAPAGGLGSGNKVRLGRFEPNTGIGWFLMPNAWRSETVTDVSQIKYSNPAFNTYTGEAYRQHMIMLNDTDRELLLLGFEDTTRPGGDNDFNDAIFYVSANPYNAVETAGLKPVKKAVDSDNDGVLDHIDEYPNDSERVTTSWYPAKNTFATLMVEDLWPTKGDYDFNDLVLDYNIEYVRNTSNDIKDVNMTYRIKAVGGTFENGFGFEFGTLSNNILSVTGNQFSENIFTLTEQNVEALDQTTFVPLFDNAHKFLTTPPGYGVTNVIEGQPYKFYYERTVRVTFKNAVNSNQLGAAPHNPTLIVNKERGREVHLKNMNPTNKSSRDLLGTGDDRFDQTTGASYQTSNGLPWMLNISSSIPHMLEGKDFIKGYPRFNDWAGSNGSIATDWYLNLSGYRNTDYLYK